MVNYDRAVSRLNHSALKVGTGKKLNSASEDSGGLSVAMKLDMDKLKTNSHKVNLQNFITFLQNQDDALSQASKIYERMSVLAQMATDPFLTETENGASSVKELLNIEFKELSERLSSLIDMEMNGRILFGGVKTDFIQGLQDGADFSPTNLPQITANYVKATSRVMTLDLSPGIKEDHIWNSLNDPPGDFESFFVPHAGDGKADRSGLSAKLCEYFDTFIIEFNSRETKLDSEFHSNHKIPSGVVLYSSTGTEMHVANFSMFLGVDLERIVVAGGELLLYEPQGKSTEITMIGVNTGNAATYEIFAAYEPSIAWNEHDMPVEGGYNFRTEIHGIYGSDYFFNHETAKKSCS